MWADDLLRRQERIEMDRFQGTESYILSDALREIVNAAIVLKRPLLLKGEPGTGKTELASVIAQDLDLPLMRWNIKSTSKATEGLYVYDTVQRLNDSRFHDKDVSDIKQYIKLGKLGEALRTDGPVVLLIDEIDCRRIIHRIDCHGEDAGHGAVGRPAIVHRHTDVRGSERQWYGSES